MGEILKSRSRHEARDQEVDTETPAVEVQVDMDKVDEMLTEIDSVLADEADRDALLREMDSVLEANAGKFIENFVQKNGQ